MYKSTPKMGRQELRWKDVIEKDTTETGVQQADAQD